MKRAFIVAASLLLACGCGKILGLGDPKAYPPDSGVAIDTAGKIPVTTADAAACGNANLVTDPNNCGRCGHDCQGGTCARAVCAPVGVSPADSEVFAVKDGRVFSLTQSQIIRTDVDGSHFLVASAAQTGHPRAIYANAAHVVWSGDDVGARLCSINGCGTGGVVQLSVAGKRTGPVGEVAGVDPLYPYIWANYTDSTIEKYAAPAPIVLATETHVEQALCPASFAGPYLVDQPAGTITLFHAAPPPLAALGASDACALAVTRTNAFYTDAANVWRAAINADGTLAARQPVATDQAAPRVVAADDDYVYWAASSAETAIVRCPITGCVGAPEVLVDELPTVTSLAVEGAFIYFAVYLDEAFRTQLYKVAK